MRTILLILLMAGTVGAEEVSFGAFFGSQGGSVVSDIQTITAKLESGRNDDFAEFAVAGITMADVGRTWTIDAANAASYGLDWELAAGLWGEPVDGWVRINMSASGAPARLGQLIRCTPSSCIRDFTMTHIDVTVHEFFTSPIGSRREASVTVFGIGRLVPEPTSGGLMLLCIPSLLLWRCFDH